MKYISIKMWAAVVACVCLAGAFQVSAIPINLVQGDGYYLGYINPNKPSGDADEEGYVNQLASMAPSSFVPIGDNTFFRSANVFVGLPSAVFSSKDDNGNHNSFTLDGTIEYVLAKYNHDDAGALVWFVNGLVGEITVPTSFNGKDLSHTDLFEGTDDIPGVPDGGATIALLGLALASVDFLRRRISRG